MTATTTRNHLYVTAELPGEGSTRVKLNAEAAIEINDRNWSTGIRMDRCWFGKGRVITQTYSIWDDGTGRCRGTVYRVISDPSEILEFCHKAQIDPPAWIKAEEA